MTANRAASIRARLKQHTDTSKQDFNLTLTRYGLERLLYRLSVSEHTPNFLLKGALLFQLWYGHEWQEILRQGKWRKILGRTRRAQELRQASPLTAVLPEQVRQGGLDQVGQLRKGLVLGGPKIETPA